MLDFLIGAPYIIGQGRSGSYVDKAARAIPGMTPDKDTDIGRAAGQFLQQFLLGIPRDQAIRGRSGAKRATENKEAGSRPLMNLPPSVNTNLAAYDESVTLPPNTVGSAGNAGGYSPPPATNLPPSPEETPAMMDPYAYNLAVYGQGRTAAGTQEERKAVQNLGMAIHQRLFPKLNNKTSFNPLMDHLKRTFPDRYPQSLDAFIEERGIQKPASMTEADSAVALADATNAVEPLLTPEIAEQLRLARQQGRL